MCVVCVGICVCMYMGGVGGVRGGGNLLVLLVLQADQGVQVVQGYPEE